MVLFVVSTWGEGKGGHFNTLATYINGYKGEYHLLVVGKKIPSVLQHFQAKTTRIDFKWMPKVKCVKDVEVIHCFDQWAYLYGYRLALKYKGIKLILTKSGGVNAKWFPKATNMWLISKENYDFYKNFKVVKHIDYYDNRIIDFPLVELSSDLQVIKDKSTVVLRIGRVSEYYNTSFTAFIKAAKQIKDAKFICIGSVESEALRERMVSANILVLDNTKYTSNAKQYLSVADVFVGQGRSAMEAIAKGIPTFVYNKKNDDLCMVDGNNINEVKWANFSERANFDFNTRLSSYLEENNNAKVEELKDFVKYNPNRIVEFYKATKPQKTKWMYFPVPLFLRYILRLIKHRR